MQEANHPSFALKYRKLLVQHKQMICSIVTVKVLFFFMYGDNRLSCGALVWRERTWARPRARPRVCAVVALLLCCSLTSVVRVVTETVVLGHGQSRHCSLSEKAR